MSATALAVAFGGGVVSLLSPCVLPVVPAYLSITTGLGMSEPQRRPDLRSDPQSRSLVDPGSRPEQRARGPGVGTVIRGGGLFVAGFSVVFVLLGLSATAIGSLLLRNHIPVTRVSGLAVIAMALALLTSTMPVPWVLGRELRFHPQVSRHGAWAAPVAGAAFAFGWTPCIGPVLGSVLAVAGDQRQLGAGCGAARHVRGGSGTAILDHRADVSPIADRPAVRASALGAADACVGDGARRLRGVPGIRSVELVHAAGATRGDCARPGVAGWSRLRNGRVRDKSGPGVDPPDQAGIRSLLPIIVRKRI